MRKRTTITILMAAVLLTTNPGGLLIGRMSPAVSSESSSDRLSILDRILLAIGWRAPLRITIPKPMFISTPVDIRIANLEKPTGKPRPPFIAPSTAYNVALNKPIACSDPTPIIGDVTMINDGKKEARMGRRGMGNYVELEPGLQDVTIDLQGKYKIYAVVVWHFHCQTRAYHDVIVQAAMDADMTQGVRTLFNNDNDNSSGLGVGADRPYIDSYEGKLIDGRGVCARYIRLYSNGNTSSPLNHYIEVEVYGKPAG